MLRCAAMLAGDLPLTQFLRGVSDTRPFREYCLARGIPHDAVRCSAAIAALPPETRVRIHQELAEVSELSDPDGNDHLLAAGGETPPADDVPGGAALALWYLLHRPRDFRDVFLHHEAAETHAWRCARGPAGVPEAEVLARADALRDALLGLSHGDAAARFCAVEAHAQPDGIWFTARVAGRVQLVEGFSETGLPSLHRIRPAATVQFVYAPADGSVLLRSQLRTADRIEELFRCFGRVVLRANVSASDEAFDLDRLRYPFHPLPDADDMVLARVRTLHVRYPARLGRRLLKLETLAQDEPDAMDCLLRAHGCGAEGLTVIHAELQIRFLAAGQPHDVAVRLWRDRSNLTRTPLGIRLRRCLRQWGLTRE